MADNVMSGRDGSSWAAVILASLLATAGALKILAPMEAHRSLVGSAAPLVAGVELVLAYTLLTKRAMLAAWVVVGIAVVGLGVAFLTIPCGCWGRYPVPRSVHVAACGLLGLLALAVLRCAENWVAQKSL